MDILNATVRRVSDVLGWVAMVFMAILMFGVTADVAARAIYGQSVPGLFEMSELSMVMVVFLGLGWTLRDDAHIRVTMLTDRLAPRPRRLAGGLAWLCAALVFLLLAWPSTQEAAYSFSIREFRWGVVQIPIWWTKIALAAGLWFAAVQAVVKAVLVATDRDLPESHPAPVEY
ncbi:TRAP-type C4-dicarboxylate transport system, small permease component [Paracoccus solventivorans]|uniref:TRAP transporter small permease protein n=1 Tax=Paracoccus solventivorans TaxID=53463 RepID=A0A1M7DXJ7_9RHOB|nr:TRAP transporter small permease [Paracoccus solventivorans]SHL84167.1 TRAP-type C4-dicarboxylate transport system, small permease component [Paracoccus solventivorans]